MRYTQNQQKLKPLSFPVRQTRPFLLPELEPSNILLAQFSVQRLKRGLGAVVNDC